MVEPKDYEFAYVLAYFLLTAMVYCHVPRYDGSYKET